MQTRTIVRTLMGWSVAACTALPLSAQPGQPGQRGSDRPGQRSPFAQPESDQGFGTADLSRRGPRVRSLELRVKTIAGEVLEPDDLSFQLTVMHFWAGWHRGSLDSLGTVKTLLEEYEPRGVRFLSVALDPSREQAREALITAEAIDVAGWTHAFNIEHQPALDTVFFSETYAIPTVVVLGPARQVLWQGDLSGLATMLPSLVEEHEPQEAQRIAALEKSVGMTVKDARAMLEYARDALRQEPKDFVYMLQLVGKVPEGLDEVPDVLAQGRDIGRALLGLNPAEQAEYSDARRITTQGAMRLDRLTERASKVNLSAGRPEADALTAKTRYDMGQAAVDSGNRAVAYGHFKWVVENAPSSPAGEAALVKIAEFDADAEFTAELAATEANRLANAELQMAKAYLAAEQADIARTTLQKIIDTWPDSQAAAEAKTLLEANP